MLLKPKKPHIENQNLPMKVTYSIFENREDKKFRFQARLEHTTSRLGVAVRAKASC